MNIFKIKNKIKNSINNFFYDIELTATDFSLINIRKEVQDFVSQQKISTGPKILYGPTFGCFQPTQVQDFLISQSLILRGAKIVPLSMGKLEEGASSFGGGHWTGIKENIDDEILTKLNHKKILKSDKKLWQIWSELHPLYLSDFLTTSKWNELKNISKNYDMDEYKTWSYKGMPVGQWTLDTLRNNYMVGDEKLVNNYKIKLQKLLFNTILCIESLELVLNFVKPDIIISNDSFYYPWAALEFLAKKNVIPFYSYWTPVGRGGACAYAKNEPAMAINLTPVWATFKKIELTHTEEQFIDDIFKFKKRGQMLVINTADPKSNNIHTSHEIQIDFDKPTALLTSNVIWDLAALNKDIQFDGMFDWIISVIKFFQINPQWQLIVKPHPAEENQYIPITQQRVNDVVLANFNKIQDNIVLLDPKTGYDVYYFFNKIKIGLVFTSTAGLEMACNGIPVVTAGRAPYFDKGFTYDTKNKTEYFDILIKLLTTNLGKQNSKTFALLAKKFFKLNFFHYYMRTNLFDYAADKKDGISLNISSAKDLIPGKNLALDYICDSILKNKPIVSENNWPPFISGNL